ncbi:hypothetical protein SFC43_13455 [Bacteroides sp. CR5/BHMF/2]|nr:hypothetical protein [Bacteroides sp. CR5/BHMF/2]
MLVDTQDENGKRVAYTLNMPAYDKLVRICGATYNPQRLKEFLNTIKKTGRRLDNIPDREIALWGRYPEEAARKLRMSSTTQASPTR